MGYYSNYLIKSIIRRIVNLLINKRTLKILLFVLILGLISFKICNNTTFAASIVSDSTYFDAVQADTLQIDIVQNDILSRVRNLYDNHKEDLDLMISRINSGNYDVLTFYGNADGSSYNNTNVNSKNVARVVLVPVNSSKGIANWSNWGSNGNITVSSLSVSNRGGFSYNFYFDQSLSIDNLASGFVVHYPNFLINYRNGDFIDGLYDLTSVSDELINETIIDSSNNIIDNQNNNTQQIIENQNQTKDEILNSDISEDSIIINTDGLAVTDDYGIDNFFSKLLEITQSGLVSRASISSLDFTIPFIDYNVSIPGNVLSNAITNHFGDYSSYLINLIHTFWTVYFGSFFIMFAKRMFNWLSTGKIVEKGGYSFIEFLDTQNTIIDSYMM